MTRLLEQNRKQALPPTRGKVAETKPVTGKKEPSVSPQSVLAQASNISPSADGGVAVKSGCDSMPVKEIVQSDSMPVKEIVQSDSMPAKDIVKTDSMLVKEIVKSDCKSEPVNEIVKSVSDRMPVKEMVKSDSMPVKEMVQSDSMLVKEIVKSDCKSEPVKEIVKSVSDRMPVKEVVKSDSMPGKGIVKSDCNSEEPVKEMVKSDSDSMSGNEIVISDCETEPVKGIVKSDCSIEPKGIIKSDCDIQPVISTSKPDCNSEQVKEIVQPVKGDTSHIISVGGTSKLDVDRIKEAIKRKRLERNTKDKLPQTMDDEMFESECDIQPVTAPSEPVKGERNILSAVGNTKLDVERIKEAIKRKRQERNTREKLLQSMDDEMVESVCDIQPVAATSKPDFSSQKTILNVDRIKEALKRKRQEKFTKEKLLETVDDEMDSESWIERELENGIVAESNRAEKRRRL